MIIIFFGRHSNDWMHALSKRLIKFFPKAAMITDIKNINTISELKKQDLSSAYIIPLMETHMIQLYQRNIAAKMPMLEHIQLFSCKNKFASYIKEKSLEDYAPKVYTSIDEITKDNLYIIKPYAQNNGANIYIKKNLTNTDFENKIVQEYIKNSIEYVSYVISKNGVIIKCLTYEYRFKKTEHIRMHPVNTQDVSTIILDDKYVKQLELFYLNCGYTGISNVDFIIHDDKVKVFEINPRLGGTLVRYKRSDLVEFLMEMINI